MNQVPHITIEQAPFIFGKSEVVTEICMKDVNLRISAYNKANANQEQYITADEARKLGAGKAEWRWNESETWSVIGHQYGDFAYSPMAQYRAIKQPEPVETAFAGLKKVSTEKLPPEFEKILHENLWELYESDKPVEPHVELKAMYEQQIKNGTLDDFVWQVADDYEQWHDVENNAPQFEPYANFHCVPKPTCQVRNDDTGELKTMTREAAKNLFAETIESCNWNFIYDDSKIPAGMVKWSPPVFKGIYTYKRKANLVKLNGKLMSREAAIAEWESKKDTCDVWIRSDINEWLHLSNPIFNSFEPSGVHVEYQLRERPLKQIEWKDVPVGVMTNKGELRKVIYTRHAEGARFQVETRQNSSTANVTEFYSANDLELAPADQQPWIAVQDKKDYGVNKVEGLIYLWRSNHSYCITGIAKGYELK